MSWFWMNMPLAVAFFGVWVGVPMWLVLKHPDRGPAPVAAQAPVQARQAAPADPQITVAPQRPGQLAGVG
jgi:hypothetical protein